MIRLNEEIKYYFGDNYCFGKFCQQRTFEYLDNWYIDEDTHELLNKNLCENLELYIENTSDIYDAMFEDYYITKKHTVHFNRTVESVVWSGFLGLIKSAEYGTDRIDMSTLSRQLKKWLETRSGKTGDAIYSELNPCYNYFKKERARKEQEILSEEE